MLKVLLKKQFLEVFKGYFFDAKKNKMRPKGAIAGWFVFFIVIMVGLLGGTFLSLSRSICPGLTQAGMGWLYFLLMGGIAILLGVFGSVFNTYSGLYLSKDNDLLLSMPIPVRTIMAARLLNVYLMGSLYSTVVLLPALIVHWITVGVTARNILGGIVLLLVVTVFVLMLSCILGWGVAKISLRLKNKSFITVILSLLFVGGYYFLYFKASALIRELIRNAAVYGEKIKGAAYGLFLFGKIGEGSLRASALFLGVTAVLFALIWIVLSRTFLTIAASGGKTKKTRYAEKTVKGRSSFAALLGKEFAFFTSRPNYMLNCGLGVLLIPSVGVMILLKGKMFCETIAQVFPDRPDSAAVLFCAALCMLSSMNDMAAPSVSLEGKTLWIAQSLPVLPKTVLRAKASMQLILTGLPVLASAVCVSIATPSSAAVKVLLCAAPLTYAAFTAVFDSVLGIKMPILNWTNEIVPIKQSGSVMIAMFGTWFVCILFGGLYLAVGYKLGAAAYLLLWSVLFAAAGLLMLRWLDREGASIYKAL